MTENRVKRFILINVVSPFTSRDEAEKDLAELKSLVTTLGGSTIVHVIQRRMTPDSGTYIGSGKAEEVARLVLEDKIDVIVINSIVKPTQLFNLKKKIWNTSPQIEVWDRIDLILNIFEKNAHTAEAKLQIDLARMRHMGPRIYGLGGILSRQGGGIGTQGIGETNIELMKRHWRNEIKKVNDRLQKLAQERMRQLERRKERGLQTISIVGYTNAGKTSLFNCLTGKLKISKDVLFATLDTTVGKLYLPTLKREVLLSDTIGFIQKLPSNLVEAFKSTLLESIHADLLIHVIDIFDPLMHEKIHVVEKILHELGIEDKKRIYVFNKVDIAHYDTFEDLSEVYREFTPQFVSVKTRKEIDKLLSLIEKRI